MSDKHYLYGRVRLFGASPYFLNYDGGVGRIDADTGNVDFTLYVYAKTANEALSIVRTARAAANAFKNLADDLERYIACHDFTKPGGVSQPECDESGIGARAEYETLPAPRSDS
jgi:hypothetical protein